MMPLGSVFSLRTCKVKILGVDQGLQEAEGSFCSLAVGELAHLAGIKKDLGGCAAKNL